MQARGAHPAMHVGLPAQPVQQAPQVGDMLYIGVQSIGTGVGGGGIGGGGIGGGATPVQAAI